MFTYNNNTKTILILGGGELAKEICISASRLGLKTIVVDNYGGSPASYICAENYICNMHNYNKLKSLFYDKMPDYCIVEKESINIDLIKDMELEGYNIVPNAKSIELCMQREKLRQFVDDLGIPTSKFQFCNNSLEEFKYKIARIGYPAVVKPCMSSSGYGQSIIYNEIEIGKAYKELGNARGDSSRVIIEEFIDFDYEITLLTTKHGDNIHFSPPIIHRQKHGDFYLSYQVDNIVSKDVELQAQKIAEIVIRNMCPEINDSGLFGVELFVLKNGKVIFNEIAPRTHDTGYLTLKTQNISQFDLLINSIINIPIPNIYLVNQGISHSLIIKNQTDENIKNYEINLVQKNNLFYYIFNKPNVKKNSTRRVGIVIMLSDESNFLEEIEYICREYKY
jgi:phosphoribosylglycinamide formyltransferase 2